MSRRKTQQAYFFYLARCQDRSLYAGICIDLEQRQRKHNDGTASKYTRSRRPVVIVYSEQCPDRSAALKREAHVRRWSKPKKEALVRQSDIAKKERGRVYADSPGSSG